MSSETNFLELESYRNPSHSGIAPPSWTNEQLSFLLKSIQKKKASGLTEENDAEFARIISLIQTYYSSSKSLQQPTASTNQFQWNNSQIQAVRFQIQALKHLQANEPVPELLQNAIHDNAVTKTGNGPRPTGAGVGPGKKNQHFLIPQIMPTDKSIKEQQLENSLYHKAIKEYRIQELENVDSNLNHSDKIKALIELKALKLAERQKELRLEIMSSLAKNSSLSTALDRSLFRRTKKVVIREARQTEKQERAMRGEKDKRERQKHLDYVQSIISHARDFMNFSRTVLARNQRLGGAVLRFHANAVKEEERRTQYKSQERMNALKSNDEAAYMALLDKTKDKRITTILNQTTSFLSKLTTAVEHQKSSVGDLPDAAAMEVHAAKPNEDSDMPLDYYATAHRIQEIVTEQSSLLVGGTLKDYQIKGLQWMVSLYNNRLNGILADEMGLGKTIQTLSLITYLIEKKKQPGPFLVIVPLSTMTNWVLEFEKWAPSVVKIVYKGSPNERKNLASQVRVGNFNVLLTTFEYVINPKDRPTLSKVKWVHMIIDEGHRMKNSNSRLSITLMTYYTSRYRLILTGTPLQNNLPELWALLNFILPKIFNSVKSFDEWFNSPFNASSINERIELNEEEQLLIIRRLHKVLRPFLLRRLKKDVEKELPDKVETVIKCPMSALQIRLYEQIRAKKFGQEGFAKKKALNNIVMQFRKICNHPYVFGEVEDLLNPAHMTDNNLFRVAGKFELLDRILPKLKSRDHRVLMFFQMTAIMDIMEDYLRWKGITYLRLDGNTKADERTTMLKAYNSSDNPPFMFLLSTRAGGLGLNLQSADTVIIYDSDWNPHQDLQAQDRAHRIGQKKEVRILRLVTSKSIEENILQRAKQKLDLDGKVIQAGKFDNKTSDREREELLKSLLGGDDEEDDEEREGEIEDSELNEIIARNEDELEWYNQMDAERRAEEGKAWTDAGNSSPTPSRLIQDSELPDVFLIDVNEPDVVVKELPQGRGARSRKQVAYDDGLTEDQFLNAVDEGDLAGYIERKEERAKKLKEGKARKAEDHKRRREAGEEVDSDADAFEDVPENPHDLPAPEELDGVDGGPMKRVADEPIESSPKKARSKPKKHFAQVDPDMVDTLESQARENLHSVMLSCYKAVEQLEVTEQEVEEEFTRRRCELFLSLPDRQDYVDYYKLITHPIALDMILHRINSPYYTNLQQFSQDFNLMFNNAMTYNVEGSQVFTDAIVLKTTFQETLNKSNSAMLNQRE